jgi:DNA-binding CsgD family transcriptional regulator
MMALSILTLHKRRMQNLRIRLKTENEIDRIYTKSGMTSREIEIIGLLKRKKSYRDIEEELFISYHTVKNHIYNIFKKLGVSNRAELIYYFKSVEDEIRKEKK